MTREAREAARALAQTLVERAQVYRDVGADHPDGSRLAEAANTLLVCLNALDAQEAATDITHQQLVEARNQALAQVARLEHELAALTSTAPGAP